MAGKNAVDACQSQENPAQTKHDEPAVDDGRERNLTKLAQYRTLKDIAYRVECRIIRISNKVKHSLPQNLSAHGNKESEMKHITSPQEPVHEQRRHRSLHDEC